MKELSIEEKAKRYDEAIERAKEINNEQRAQPFNIMTSVFPELKESEDERIKKHLIKHFGNKSKTDWNGMPVDIIIAWLEKQGENNKWKPSKDEMDALYGLAYITNKMGDKKDEAITKLYQDLKREFFDGASYENMFPSSPVDVQIKLEKQGEQKPADKVEPKFEIGDWVVYDHRAYQVVELPKEGYINLGLRRNGKIEFAPSTYCRHWTIQDAKNGDVLACPNDAGDRDVVFIFKNINSDEGWVFCFCASDANGCFCTNNDYVGNSNSTNISPATKEQRDLLFKKMHEAGYEWDAEKKELKKIEQKSAWSEYDEEFLLELSQCCDLNKTQVQWLLSLKDRVQPRQELGEEDERILTGLITSLIRISAMTRTDSTSVNFAFAREIDWLKSLRLKSLRPQNRWKPSDEQMNTLEHYMHTLTCNEHKEILFGLYTDLKKLKGE